MPTTKWVNSDIQHDIVSRYCADTGATPERAERALVALDQFLSVCSTSDGVRAPSEAIDDMWHTSLLFTREYAEHCANRYGAFIHHKPVATLADPVIYARTLAEASERFGDLDDDFWTSVDNVARCGGCGSIYQPQVWSELAFETSAKGQDSSPPGPGWSWISRLLRENEIVEANARSRTANPASVPPEEIITVEGLRIS